MRTDAIAVFSVVDASLRARLLERLQQPPGGAGLIAWRLSERFPSTEGDAAQCEHLARMVYGLLGDQSDAVIGDEPGVWVVADDDAAPFPRTLDEARRRGVCLTRAHAGTPEQRDAEQRLEVDAAMRAAQALQGLAPTASLEEQLREVLSRFTQEEIDALDVLAAREGSAGFAEQVRGTLIAARPVANPFTPGTARVAECLDAPRFDGVGRRVVAWASVTQLLEGLPSSLAVEARVQGVLRALTASEREALEALAVEDGDTSFEVQLRARLRGLAERRGVILATSEEGPD